MKNNNIDHGQKNLYFNDYVTCASFINLYRDLFIGGWFEVDELNTSRGKVIWLRFMMKHQQMYHIRKVLGTKKRSFVVKDTGFTPYRVTREFVEA